MTRERIDHRDSSAIQREAVDDLADDMELDGDMAFEIVEAMREMLQPRKLQKTKKATA